MRPAPREFQSQANAPTCATKQLKHSPEAVLNSMMDLRRQPVRREVAPKRGRLSFLGCDYLGVQLEALRLERAVRAYYHVE